MNNSYNNECPDCGTPNFTPAGLRSHRGGKNCQKRRDELIRHLSESSITGGPFQRALRILPEDVLRKAAEEAVLKNDLHRHNAILPVVIERGKVATKPLTTIDGAVTVVHPKPVEVVAPHNQYHRNGMLATAQAVCWLVMTGFELAAKKNDIPRGNWESWVAENCEYSIRTAQKYMGLAEGIKGRMAKTLGSKTNRGSFLDLLGTAPSTLTPEQQKTLLKTVHELTDGNTIRELYLDFGIIKPPKKDEPQDDPEKPAPTPEEAITKLLHETREWVDDVLTGPLKAKHWRLLEDTETLALAVHFEEQAKTIRDWLNTPQKDRQALSLEDLK